MASPPLRRLVAAVRLDLGLDVVAVEGSIVWPQANDPPASSKNDPSRNTG